MYKPTIRLLVFSMLLITIGCSDDSADVVESAAPTAELDMPELAAYTGPPIVFRVTPAESSTQFDWSVDVRSGGWEIKFDGSTSDPRTGHATIKLLLIKPGPDEMVNQALATLTGEYKHGSQSFKIVDLVVKQIIRGEAEEDAEYQRAEIWRAGDK